jgi:hypothetical protein
LPSRPQGDPAAAERRQDGAVGELTSAFPSSALPVAQALIG